VQVHHCDEGVANHIGPEPCAVACKGGGEASVGESIGQPLSLENYLLLGRRRGTHRGRQHVRRAIASAWTAQRGQRTWHVQTLLVREPGDPSSGHRRIAAVVRIGKARSRSR
jgi:hypothetical protein